MATEFSEIIGSVDLMAYEFQNNTGYTSNIHPLQAVSNTATSTTHVLGMKFNFSSLAAGDTINAVGTTLKWTCLNTTHDDVRGFFYGHGVAASGDFSADPDCASRVKTTASMGWTADGVGAGTRITCGDAGQQANLKTILDEIKALPSWAGSFTILYWADVDAGTLKSCRVFNCAAATGGDDAKAPILTIDYTPAAAGGSNPSRLALLNVG